MQRFFIFLLGASIPIGAGCFLWIGANEIFSFLSPPRVVKASSDIRSDNPSSFVVKFDKPIKRKELSLSIYPEARGEIQFAEPLLENHLFTELRFSFAEPLTAQEYEVALANIQGFGRNTPSSFEFSFQVPSGSAKMLPEGQRQSVVPDEDDIVLLPILVDFQDSPLSCEAASLKMALSQKGVFLTEKEIMEEIGYTEPARRRGDVWGDPNEGFVGDIEGSICSTGFGVFWDPVSDAALKWRDATVIRSGSVEDITGAISNGDPVIIWGRVRGSSLTSCSWKTPNGVYVPAYRETHVMTVVGYKGKKESPSVIIVNDPIAGRQYMPTQEFLSNWSTFGESGVIVH